MDFLGFIANHVRENLLSAWWSRLTANGCPSLQKNIQEDQIFTTDKSQAINQLTVFADDLPSPPSADPTKDAALAISRRQSMVCAGPLARLAGDLARVQSLVALRRHNFKVRGEPGFDPYGPESEMEALIDLLVDDSAIKNLLDPDRPFKGRIPVLFWAATEDLITFCEENGYSIRALRLFLGLETKVPPEPAVLFRLASTDRNRYVPTGFDGFDHQYFKCPVSGANHGLTANLYDSTRSGAREVVTSPVLSKDIEFMRVIS
jgi:hypothetical protein